MTTNIERLHNLHNHKWSHHQYMFKAAKSLAELIEYASDSTIDEYENELDCVLDQDCAEENLACGYGPRAFDDPTSGDYRSFCTEIEEYQAIRNHLTDDEKQQLQLISPVWELAENPDARNLKIELQELFDNLMKWLGE